MSDSDSTEPNESFEDQVKKVMMKQFYAIEDNMRLFLKREVAKRNQEELDRYIRKYIETKLTKDIEGRVYKALQMEIRGRLDQIAEDISVVDKSVEELRETVQLKYDLVIGDGRQGRSILDRKIEEIGNYIFESTNTRESGRRWKIHEEISSIMRRLQIAPPAAERTGWFGEKNDPSPTVQLQAAREVQDDPTLLLKDLPLLHM